MVQRRNRHAEQNGHSDHAFTADQNDLEAGACVERVTSEMKPLVGKYTWRCGIPASCRTSDDASSISSQLASIRLRSFAGSAAGRRLAAVTAFESGMENSVAQRNPACGEQSPRTACGVVGYGSAIDCFTRDDVRQEAIEFLLHDPVAFAGLRRAAAGRAR
jgi:hypothetical protein